MLWIPFLCLALGLWVGARHISPSYISAIDRLTSIALIILMLTIGLNIGINDELIAKLPTIGLQCLLITVTTIFCSIVVTVFFEKTVIPLDRLLAGLNEKIKSTDSSENKESNETGFSPLLWILPLSILAGVLIGVLLPSAYSYEAILDNVLTASLILLYTSVGIGLGHNLGVFQYIKILGAKILLLPLAILIGSLLGGFLSGLILGLPLHVSMTASGGLGYYSITGTYMSQAYGVEWGTYGFIVNVLRDVCTVLLLPLTIKISKGSPIASAASGTMDTMLVPVTKFVGVELGLVALVSGTVLSLLVPVLLPVLGALLT